jgi:hypothetical protein
MRISSILLLSNGQKQQLFTFTIKWYHSLQATIKNNLAKYQIVWYNLKVKITRIWIRGLVPFNGLPRRRYMR